MSMSRSAREAGGGESGGTGRVSESLAGAAKGDDGADADDDASQLMRSESPATENATLTQYESIRNR